MAKIHMVLQGKGGVGKSVIAALIAQYKASKGQAPLCLDIPRLHVSECSPPPDNGWR